MLVVLGEMQMNKLKIRLEMDLFGVQLEKHGLHQMSHQLPLDLLPLKVQLLFRAIHLQVLVPQVVLVSQAILQVFGLVIRLWE